MRVVLDTNVFMVVMGSRSEFRFIFDYFLQGRFVLLVSTDIMLEYAEVLASRHSPAGLYIIQTLLENLPNVEGVEVWYRWNLIYADPDDNKFVDCAIAGGADVLVTEDTHYNIMRDIDFPPLNILSLQEFAAFISLQRT
jgi:uncharacterized protein